MKLKTAFLLFFIIILCLASCGEEVKRPTQCPNTAWNCADGNITFSVNADGKAENASLLNNNGDTVKASVVFTDPAEKTVAFYSEDGKELYFSGTCVYKENSFTVWVTDLFGGEFSYLPPMLVFNKTAE